MTSDFVIQRRIRSQCIVPDEVDERGCPLSVIFHRLTQNVSSTAVESDDTELFDNEDSFTSFGFIDNYVFQEKK
jgi:hypothetical protein